MYRKKTQPPPNKKKESYLKHPCQRLRNPFLLSLSPDYLSTPPPKKKGKMNFIPIRKKILTFAILKANEHRP